MAKVTIDRPGCISCESCWTICPEIFEQDPADDLSSITKEHRTNDNPAEGDVPDDLLDCAIEAADACPVSVIFVEE